MNRPTVTIIAAVFGVWAMIAGNAMSAKMAAARLMINALRHADNEPFTVLSFIIPLPVEIEKRKDNAWKELLPAVVVTRI